MLALFFNPAGRIAQYEFTLAWLFWFLLELGCVFGFMAAEPKTPSYSYWFLFGMAVSSFSTVSVVMLGIKRLRDAAMPVWLAIIFLVPLVSLIALVMLSNMPTRHDKPVN